MQTTPQDRATPISSKRRLEGKVALVIGAGQSPGYGLGNGRASALLFAREGAQVIAADRDSMSAQETVDMIQREGGSAAAFQVDAASETELKSLIAHCIEQRRH
jgi:NAD(P)-dependent dehydrogenase (short-subunit alcohol dehydrogenase family)